MLAIALVYAWLLQNPHHYSSWVNGYVQTHWDGTRHVSKRVSGHWRRRADWASVLPSLRGVCKFDREIVRPVALGPPVRTIRQRRDDDGELIPRKYRVTVFAI
jgi:hypothetical protein